MSQQSLKDKTIKGTAWSIIDNVSRLGVTFIVGIVLARLLSPEIYGLIGILTIFISVFNAIVDSGFTNALIRKKDATSEDFSTVFYTNLILSIVLALCLYSSANVIAKYFSRPELVSLTKVMSSIIIINALCIVQKARLTKQIDFKRQTKITFISSVTSGCIGTGMAYAGYGVWALVAQQITNQALTTLQLWFTGKWFPRLEFSRKSFTEMWGFGWKLLASELINTTWKEVYQIVVGKCYSPATLGLYTRAKQFSQLFSSNITQVVQRVTYPVLSSIQDDRVRLKASYKRIIKITMFPTFILMVGLAACAEPMIVVLLGERWIESAPFLQIISFAGMLYPLHAINLNMLQVQGRSDLFLKLEIIKKIIAVVPILLGIFVDIYAMVGCSVVTSYISFLLNAKYSGPFLNYSIKEQVMDILPSFGIAITMGVPVYALSFLPLKAFVIFPLQIICGFILIIIISNLTKNKEFEEITRIVMSFVKNKI